MTSVVSPASGWRTQGVETTARLVGAAALTHLVTRAVTLGALLVASQGRGGLGTAIERWDGRWYRSIAEHGYPDALPRQAGGEVVTNETAFFPLYPWIVRPFVALGVPFWIVAVVVGLVVSTAAAVAIALAVREYATARAAFFVSAAWSVFPTAAVLSTAYAEGLFTLFAAATLYAVLRRQWWAAGACCALAGFTRPTGVILVAAVVVAAAQAIVTRRDVRSLVAVALGSLGVTGAIAHAGLRTGELDAWFVTQREGWQVTFDGGYSFWRWVAGAASEPRGMLAPALAVAVVGLIVLTVLALVARPPLPVATYLVLGMLLALGQGGAFYLSMVRFALPIFPVLLPLGVFLARVRTGLAVAAVGTACAVSALVGVYYFTVPTAASP